MNPDEYEAYLKANITRDFNIVVCQDDENIEVCLQSEDNVIEITTCNSYAEMANAINDHLSRYPNIPVHLENMKGYIFTVRTQGEENTRFMSTTSPPCPFRRRQQYADVLHPSTVSFEDV